MCNTKATFICKCHTWASHSLVIRSLSDRAITRQADVTSAGNSELHAKKVKNVNFSWGFHKNELIKGIVHPKMKILSSFIHPQVVPNLYECLCSEHKGRYSEEWGKQSSSGAPLTSIVFLFPPMEVNGAPKQPDYKLSSEYLPLCSEQTHSYRFGTTWGWVNDDRIFIFGWTVPLSPRLAIPMRQIVIKHIKSSLFVRFLRGVPFSLLTTQTVCDHDKYTHIHWSTVLKYSHKHNLLCLKWTFEEKHQMCNIILDLCITLCLNIQTVCHINVNLTIKEKRESLAALELLL